MKVYKNFIDNEWVDSSDGQVFEVINPSNEEVIATVPMSTVEDVERALSTAEVAQKEWGRLPAIKRAEYIIKVAEALEAKSAEIGKLLTTEQGKLAKHGVGEVFGTARFLRYAAESARRIEGETLKSDNQNEEILIQRLPYGVTVGLLTWNYPLALAGRKLGNALVTGNAMVLMPPLHAPLAILELGHIMQEILPKGLVNIITGSGAVVGNALVKNPITKMISLTGSTPVGINVAKAAAEHLAVVSLELGGKTPYIVMEDGDVDRAAQMACASAYFNCGQICTSNERMYIHEDIYDEFLEKFLSHVKQLKVGDPFDETTTIGPKMNLAELNKCNDMVQKAKAEGATILHGGKILKEGQFAKGFWFEPTVITDVKNDMEIVQEETFGPIVSITKISSFDEALKLANDSKYGLAGVLFTNNYHNIMIAMREMEVGELFVNRTSGEMINGFHAGVKLSGIGGEDGKHGLDLYSQKKAVYLNYQ